MDGMTHRFILPPAYTEYVITFCGNWKKIIQRRIRHESTIEYNRKSLEIYSSLYFRLSSESLRRHVKFDIWNYFIANKGITREIHIGTKINFPQKWILLPA